MERQGGRRGKGASRVGGIHLCKCLVHFQCAACDHGGVKDYFVTKSNGLFDLLRAVHSVVKVRETFRVRQFARLR